MSKKTNKKKKRTPKSKVKTNTTKDENDFIEKERDNCNNNKCPYIVKQSETLGKYLVASTEIKPGDVIIEEPAIVVGPCSGCNVICIGCYVQINQTTFNGCPGCSWPLCEKGTNCKGYYIVNGHTKEECDVLRTINIKTHSLERLKENYDALVPLRCLLLKSNDKKWSQILEMESHCELRKLRKDIWPINQKRVVDKIRLEWGFNEYTEEEIHRICGVLEVNAFEVGGVECSARALYSSSRLLVHDCIPSTTHTDNNLIPSRPITVRAATKHLPGDLISLCYAYTLQGTLKRREHLRQSKFFECNCKRCSDPTELGTYASAFICPRCSVGYVLPLEPLNDHSDWLCLNKECSSYRMTANEVQILLRRLTMEYYKIDSNDVEGYEGYLQKYRNVLHPSHYLFLSIKHSLSQLYGKVDDYMIQDLSDEHLNRKIIICRDLMKIFDIIEPGFSRLRGVTMYELHAPLMILITRDFEKKAITKDALKTRLKEVVSYLTQSAQILSIEPRLSQEGVIATAAKEALVKIKTWEQIIGKI